MRGENDHLCLRMLALDLIEQLQTLVVFDDSPHSMKSKTIMTAAHFEQRLAPVVREGGEAFFRLSQFENEMIVFNSCMNGQVSVGAIVVKGVRKKFQNRLLHEL